MTRPLANKIPTLKIPSSEKRPTTRTTRASRPRPALRRARQRRNAKAGKPPSQAPAASKWSTSDTRCRSPARLGVAPAWPTKAGKARKAAAMVICNHRVVVHGTSRARNSASARRMHHTSPKRVSVSTGQAPPCRHTSAIDVPKMSDASRTSQAAPEITATASASHTHTISWRCSVAKPGLLSAGSATNQMKPVVPAASSVAAKWAPRTRMSGSIVTAGSVFANQRPTRKVKSPCVRWVSTDITFQITL